MSASIWFWLLAAMLAVYATLDGFDFGVGILHFFIGRNEPERSTLLASIGPVWDGNEVWLVAAGGTLFAAFPVLYATAFSGFYLPLTIVLWLFLFRGLGVEIRHQLRDTMWETLWDGAFAGSSLLLAVFFGAALGNLVRGVPLDAKGNFFAPLWTDFTVAEHVGILDWFTVLVALSTCAALTLHGALWLCYKTDGLVAERSQVAVVRLLLPTALLALVTGVATFHVQPALARNLARFPVAYALPVLTAASLLVIAVRRRTQPRAAFFASSGFIFVQVLSAAFAIFPYALPARVPARSITLETAAARAETLNAMLVWWLPGMLIAAGYTYFSYSRMPKVFHSPETEQAPTH